MNSAGELLDLVRELIRQRLASFDGAYDGVEPRIRLRGAAVLRKCPGAADPCALVGDRGAHREALGERRRLRGAVEAAVGVEIGRDRDVDLLGAGQSGVLLDQARERAGVIRLSGFRFAQRRRGDRIGLGQKPALGVVDAAAEP